jgi:nucleotide-binding universal stress UspA family protein
VTRIFGTTGFGAPLELSRSMFALRRILVPIDFSEASKAALERAFGLAERFGASVTVLHAWDLPPYVTTQMSLAMPGKPGQSFEEFMLENAKNGMTEALASIEKPVGVEVAQRFVRGEAWRAITDAAKSGYDLVVMGTHGRTGLDRVLLGSVAEKVIRHAPCAVMTVRAEEA